MNLVWRMYFAFALYLQIHLISDKCCRITKILPLFPNLMQSAVPVSTLTNYQIDYRRLADSHDYDFSRQDPLNLQELLVLEDGEIFKSGKIWAKSQDLQYFHDLADIFSLSLRSFFEGIFCNCCASFVNMLHNIKLLQLRKIWGFNQTRRANLEIMLTFWWLEGSPISDLTAAGLGPPTRVLPGECSIWELLALRSLTWLAGSSRILHL